MESSSTKVFIVSGEASGDLHGSNLMKALKKIDPTLIFFGMGGNKMRQVGLKGLDMKKASVVGVAEVVKRFSHILAILRELKKMLAQEQPVVAILIDFPDFNLRLAKEAKRLNIPVAYFISPQVWAWRKGRIKKIVQLVDKMLVIFPFEVSLYEKEGLDVEYVGHPLKDLVISKLTKSEARKELGVGEGTVISILPGSRVEEVERLLPIMIEAASLIREKIKDAIFLLPVADSLDISIMEAILQGNEQPIIPVKDKLYEALKASDVAIVTSGTATLEVALMLLPMVILYKLSVSSAIIARLMLNIEHAGLPNIIAGRTIVKEFMQGSVKAPLVAKEVVDILRDNNKRSNIIEDLKTVKERLGVGGASERAAAAIYNMIDKSAERSGSDLL